MTVVQEATLPLILKGLFLFLKCLGLNYIDNVDQYFSLLFSKLRILSDYFINLLHSFSNHFQKDLIQCIPEYFVHAFISRKFSAYLVFLPRTCTCVSR